MIVCKEIRQVENGFILVVPQSADMPKDLIVNSIVNFKMDDREHIYSTWEEVTDKLKEFVVPE